MAFNILDQMEIQTLLTFNVTFNGNTETIKKWQPKISIKPKDDKNQAFELNNPNQITYWSNWYVY